MKVVDRCVTDFSLIYNLQHLAHLKIAVYNFTLLHDRVLEAANTVYVIIKFPHLKFSHFSFYFMLKL